MQWYYTQKPTAYTLARCRLFADHSADSSSDEYARRNQHSLEKIKMDIYRGKVAEFMVYDYLTFKGNDTSLPDLEIYSASYKSFDADLVCNGLNVHVKSHLLNPTFPPSWVFQKNDKLTKGSDDYLALVLLDEDWNGRFCVGRARDFEYKPPIKQSLRSKVCIYAEGL